MRTVDGRLSQRAQAQWPGALVSKLDAPQGEDQQWHLERAGVEPVGLGRHYGEAVRALGALIRAHRGA